MSESLCIDSPFRGRAMPKSYSGDLRERVIEAVEMGASRHEAAERFEVSVSSAVKWLQRWCESRSAAPKPRGGSVSPLEKCAARVLAVIADHPDLTLRETVAELRKRRIRTSTRFFGRHDITLKKSLQAAERERADVARARRRWIREQGMLDPARLVFIDETAVSTNMVRLRGRAPRGVAYDDVMRMNGDVALVLRKWLGENAMMAYLAMMAVRLLELRRVLKPEGSVVGQFEMWRTFTDKFLRSSTSPPFPSYKLGFYCRSCVGPLDIRPPFCPRT